MSLGFVIRRKYPYFLLPKAVGRFMEFLAFIRLQMRVSAVLGMLLRRAARMVWVGALVRARAPDIDSHRIASPHRLAPAVALRSGSRALGDATSRISDQQLPRMNRTNLAPSQYSGTSQHTWLCIA
eukprot:4661376-Pleurochrysis_carterae.AAC.3